VNIDGNDDAWVANVWGLSVTLRAGDGTKGHPPAPNPQALFPAARRATIGSGEREIERATAEKVCRLIVGDVFGRLRAQQAPISFDESTPILLRDVHRALDDLCRSKGWKALVKRGETQRWAS
jgi:hypothetical protein